jgi:protoporphyrin/coproporphyrin ferrochelatase
MGKSVKMKKTAVILLNLGGPLSQEEVKPFLLSLFSDPAIITLPNPFRYILARVVTRGRLKEAQHIYSLLGGGSPLLKNTKAQAQALESELGAGFRVFVAMRHAAPLTKETLQDVRTYGPEEVVLLPLYPQYSTTTTESSFKAWHKATEGWDVPIRSVPFYPSEEGFIEAIKELTLPLYRQAQKKGMPRVLMTAHGLPEKVIKKGDPYQSHVEETAKRLVEKLEISPLDAVICYQSRVGPLKWIGPSTEEEVLKAAQEKRPLVVIPLSFVSEHSETLVELDMTYHDLALGMGCPAYHRVKTVQTHPSFIRGLAGLVRAVIARTPVKTGDEAIS